ncbi:Esterase/lipase/thioesterase [Mycena venus]|uniref:Esterase/lipase/thioesterase n=1 Tax=Mycena venus TaxID=2733690 RepID=A0A8H7CE24_9AGAR|nr:Esterase/lipase/thioesterase [Mycena venus]
MSQYSHLSEPDPELPGSIPRIGGPGPLTEDMIPAMRQALDVPLSQRLDVYKTRLPSGGGDGPLPVLVYFHGGGWAFGGLDTNDFDLRILSVELRLVIVNVDYRLAPDHRFPTGLSDCYAALKWTVENAEKIGGSTDKGFLVCGASSGANLAAAVTHRSLKDPFFENHKIIRQILQIPALVHPAAFPPEYASELLSYEQNKDAPILSKELMDFLYTTQDPPPLLANHVGLPPSYLQICGLDLLRDEGLLYERLLREQGVLTKLDMCVSISYLVENHWFTEFRYPGVPHGFHAMLPGMRAAKKWEEDLCQGIK